MKSADLQIVILDVGHGNCTIVKDGVTCMVVDIPSGIHLGEALRNQGCLQVRNLVLSHMDADHIGGAIKLLADPGIRVQKVWASADSIKDTKTHIDLLYAIQNAYNSGQTGYSCNLNVSAGEDLDFGRVKVEVLHPSIVMAGVGPNRSSKLAGSISSNAMSAVLRIVVSEIPCVLLTGDMDSAAARTLMSAAPELRARVLVFPHHGGLPGQADDPEQFAENLCREVAPDLVIFSTGRGRHSNPRREIIRGVKAGAPSAHIACTQLSAACHSELSLNRSNASDCLGWPSRGGKDGSCCAGTIVMEIAGDEVMYYPSIRRHSEFIRLHVDSPQCSLM